MEDIESAIIGNMYFLYRLFDGSVSMSKLMLPPSWAAFLSLADFFNNFYFQGLFEYIRLNQNLVLILLLSAE